MTDSEAQRLREDFFAALDESMTALPYRVATDIRQGIAEELEGLDAHATSARLAQLGSPESIAREAAASVLERAPEGVSSTVPTKPKGFETSKGFAIAAALVLAFGGFAVPFVGALVGVVLVALSRLWRRWEKLVACLTPLAVVVVVTLGSWVVLLNTQGEAVESDVANPLSPAPYDLMYSAVFLGFALNIVCGLWLLWRLRGRMR